jgi:putative chitinase
MATLKDTIDSMKDSNFQKFASDQEKRTREIMNSIDQYQKNVSGESKAYADAIAGAVQKSQDLSASNLKDGVRGLKDIENVIKAQTDISKADRANLLKAADIAKMQMEAKSQSGILSKMKETISNNAIDISSVAAGLSGNSPAIMFATKYVLDKRKQLKEEKAARKKAMAEESLERLESIQAAKQSNSNAKEEAKILKATGGGAVSGGPSSGSSSELIVWNEIQAEELEKIRIGINAFLNNEMIGSRNDEENRREGSRQTEKLIDAVEGISVGGAIAGSDGEGGKSGIMSMLGGALSTMAGVLGASGLSGLFGKLTGLFAKAGPLATTIGRLAGAAAPIAAVAVGGAMIAKDVYDMASAALDNDITTEIEGKDMGGVIGGALLGTVGMFVAGPLGAGLGMALGNMVGGFVGDVVAPNYNEVLSESQTKIQASKDALSASLTTITELYNSGAITEAEYNEQKAVIESQQAMNAQHEQMAADTAALQTTMMAKGQQYNELNASIQAMEDQGLVVSQSMYDTLDALETEYDTAKDAFDEASAELQSTVDPTWYDNIKTGLFESWNMLSGAASAGFETMKAGFESARGWFAEKITALDEAFGISEGVKNAVEYVENKAVELAGTVTAAVAETAAAVDEAVEESLASLNLDDEYRALKTGTAAAVAGAKEAVQEAADYAEEQAAALVDGVDFSDGVQIEDLSALGGNALSVGADVVGDAAGAVLGAVDGVVESSLGALDLDDEYRALKTGAEELAQELVDGVDLSDGVQLQDVGALAGNIGEVGADAVGNAAGAIVDTTNAAIDAVGLRDEVEAVQELASDAVEGAVALVERGKEEVSEAVAAGVAAMGLEDEVAFVGEQLDAAGEAVAAVGDEIGDAIGSMAEGVGGWFSSWWNGGGAADGAAAAMPNLRAGNPHTEIAVDSGDAATRREAMIQAMDAQGITDPNHRAAMMAQAHHETGGFGVSEENFNYSGSRLFELFGAGNSYGNKVRFNSVGEADALVSQGKSAVGDVIYGGRMGNDAAGDGFKFRGRGAFQLTGKDNYSRYSEKLFGDDRLVQNPELVNDPVIGAQVAAAFYEENVMDRGIAGNDVGAVSRAINGGTIGLQDRADLFAAYQAGGPIGSSGQMLAAANMENDAATAALADAGTGTGSATVVNAPTTVASSSTTMMGGMASASQVMTPEEMSMMYGAV